MRIPNDEQITIFIDIDRTIIDDNGVPLNGALECIKKLSFKTNIYIWSAGGFQYAQEIVQKWNLKDYICGALPKPNYTIDDLKVQTGFSQAMIPDWEFIKGFEQFLNGKFPEDIYLLTED